MRRLYIFYTGFLVIFFLFWLISRIGGIANIPRALLSTSIDIGISFGSMFLATLVLLPKLFYRKKYFLFAGACVLLILFSGTIIAFSQLSLANISLSDYSARVARSDHFYYWFWSHLVFGSYFLVFLIMSLGTAIRFALDRSIAVHHIEQVKKEKLQAELGRLKFQLNPHFLFNALNTINYKIDRSNQPARETLQKFSRMLRYQLYECEKNSIEIEQELWFLQSYIELQRERMNSNYQVSCAGFNEVSGLHIAPFLLLPIVENCFKHVSQWTDRTNEIHISCRQERNVFFLDTYNSIAGSNGHETGGIGLKNIQQRLELLYPGAHQLRISKAEGQFTLTLQLELS